jgi:hypothetical protein
MIKAFRMIPPIIDVPMRLATGRTGFAASSLLCKVREVWCYGGLGDAVMLDRRSTHRSLKHCAPTRGMEIQHMDGMRDEQRRPAGYCTRVTAVPRSPEAVY